MKKARGKFSGVPALISRYAHRQSKVSLYYAILCICAVGGHVKIQIRYTNNSTLIFSFIYFKLVKSNIFALQKGKG